MNAILRKINIKKRDKLLLVFSIPFLVYSLLFISTYWFILNQNTVLYHSSSTYDTLNIPVQGNHNFKLVATTHRETYYPEESFSILSIDIYLDSENNSLYVNTFSVINPLDQTEPTPTSSSISASGFYNIDVASATVLTLRVDNLVVDTYTITVYKDISWIYFLGEVNFPVFGIIFLVIGAIIFNTGRKSLKKSKKNRNIS